MGDEGRGQLEAVGRLTSTGDRVTRKKDSARCRIDTRMDGEN